MLNVNWLIGFATLQIHVILTLVVLRNPLLEHSTHEMFWVLTFVHVTIRAFDHPGSFSSIFYNRKYSGIYSVLLFTILPVVEIDNYLYCLSVQRQKK